jgi:hypothetical protein
MDPFSSFSSLPTHIYNSAITILKIFIYMVCPYTYTQKNKTYCTYSEVQDDWCFLILQCNLLAHLIRTQNICNWEAPRVHFLHGDLDIFSLFARNVKRSNYKTGLKSFSIQFPSFVHAHAHVYECGEGGALVQDLEMMYCYVCFCTSYTQFSFTSLPVATVNCMQQWKEEKTPVHISLLV